MARFLFLCPDEPLASGGIAVIYEAVGFLRDAGHDAYVVQESPSFRYHDAAPDIPVLYDDALARRAIAGQPLRRRPRSHVRLRWNRLRGGPNPKLAHAADDVIVAPDFLLDDALACYPGARIVCFSQNPFAYLRACDDAMAEGNDPVAGVVANLGIAEVCLDAFEMIGARNIMYCPVAPNLPAFPYRDQKQPLVTYMPRKRPAEARLIDAALRRRGQLGGMTLAAIDGLPHAEVQKRLGDSLIFISLLKREALGFPAAEAMAAGCIVVGYTGLGTREYFDETTGVVVEEGDLPGVVRAVEAVIAEYEKDPTRLDALRRHASRKVHSVYTRDAFRDGLLAAWKSLGDVLS